MHPIMMEIFTRPVGWLAIGGSLVMVGVGVSLFLFVRRKIREEELEFVIKRLIPDQTSYQLTVDKHRRVVEIHVDK